MDMEGAGSGSQGSVPSELQGAVLVSSQPMPEDSIKVKGHDFSEARFLWTGNVVTVCPIERLPVSGVEGRQRSGLPCSTQFLPNLGVSGNQLWSSCGADH